MGRMRRRRSEEGSSHIVRNILKRGAGKVVAGNEDWRLQTAEKEDKQTK